MFLRLISAYTIENFGESLVSYAKGPKNLLNAFL